MPWVVKLGGSLADSDRLPAWLAAIAAGAGRIVLVPGGGPFADAVRASQARWGFDGHTAHRMALLAMHQYGLLLAGLRPELVPVDSESGIRAALAAARVPVWLPEPMALAAPGLEASWDLSSDSLAAWLAGRLNAERLVLVKSVEAPEPTPDALAAAGVVDPLFPAHARTAGCALSCLGPDAPARLERALRNGRMPGPPLTTADEGQRHG
ncbi:MAG: hypothetical protein R3202_13400 [Candidatus Competibacterales bacterium]|nr:hypothetical protein [Candidatus Competibacterales bacterium]